MSIAGRIFVICSSHRLCETQMLCTGVVRCAGCIFLQKYSRASACMYVFIQQLCVDLRAGP